jgi:hypothetical protein
MTRKEVRRTIAQFIADNPKLSYRAMSLKEPLIKSSICAIPA